jgi:predicted MFS family arabinose efflux permease
MALIGVCSFFVMTTLQVSIQLQLPDELRGRALALMTTVFMAGTALSSPVWGVLVDLLDSRRVLFGAAVFSLTCVVLFYKTKVDPPEPATHV